MKASFVDLYQRRMDRCQSEQLWALAVYGGLNAFVIAQSNQFTRAFQREHLLWALGVVGLLVLAFTYERLDGYYNYRNQIADLVANEQDADNFIKQKKYMSSPSGVIWVFIFVIAVTLPFLATVKITASGAGSAAPAASAAAAVE